MSWKGLLAALCVLASAFAMAADQKVVVIGFDGADFEIVQDMLNKGELPNLQRLKDSGSFAPLTPTNPPQTPVSWSTFATGINPGRTGIFDFIRRKEGSYIPDLALRGETTKKVLFGRNNKSVLPLLGFFGIALLFFLFLRKTRAVVKIPGIVLPALAAAAGLFYVASNWLPDSIPDVYTVRKGIPIWKILEEQGKSATIIRLPVTFPAEPLNGEMISGLATPDIRATIGKPSIYTNDLSWEAGDNQFSVEIKKLTDDSPHQTSIIGPPNKLFYNPSDERKAQLEGQIYPHPKDFELPMTITVTGNGVDLAIEGTNYSLAPKEWTPWIQFHYKANPLITMKGFARFYLEYVTGKKFKLYMSPVHLHPDMPVAMSYPANLAKKVWEANPYKTMGWAYDTWSIGNDLMDEDHFLDDVEFTIQRYEQLLDEFLADNDRDLFVQVFSFTDRVGHILWRFWDEGHPLYQPELGEKYREVMRSMYRRMDQIVGRVMNTIDLNTTTLLVCSDHGFASFRYQFHTNTWLVQEGYLKLKKNVLGQRMKLEDLQTGITPFQYVDWENTKAYALGLGMIFINLEGREPEGSVKAEEYEAVAQEIAARLEAYVDEATGMNPVKKVFFRDDIYSDYDQGETPDLRVANSPLWRVSWDSTLGGMPSKITEDNLQNWSGDHCSLSPEDVRGILFSSKPFAKPDPQMADMCPSMLDLLGIRTDIKMDGQSLFTQ